jgi:hypothetical protein
MAPWCADAWSKGTLACDSRLLAIRNLRGVALTGCGYPIPAIGPAVLSFDGKPVNKSFAPV